jgi:hypothetical protein
MTSDMRRVKLFKENNEIIVGLNIYICDPVRNNLTTTLSSMPTSSFYRACSVKRQNFKILISTGTLNILTAAFLVFLSPSRQMPA